MEKRRVENGWRRRNTEEEKDGVGESIKEGKNEGGKRTNSQRKRKRVL